MKKELSIWIALVFLLIGCSESFLELKPESSFTEDNFFKTEEQFENGVVGVYEALRNTVNIRVIYMAEQRSDNAHYMVNLADKGDNQVTGWEIANFYDDNANIAIGNVWSYYYSGISKANTVIQQLQGKNFSQDFKNNIEGQAKLLRAYFYFDMVRFFGGVPLYLKIVDSSDDNVAFLPRSSVEEVYNQIVADLEDADRMLTNPTFSNGKQTGRVNKGTAKMILARVFMTKPNRELSKAETLLKEITSMGYDLVDYRYLFDGKHENSVESIFEVQFKEGNEGQQSDFIYSCMPLTSETKNVTGVAGGKNDANRAGGAIQPTKEMVDSYEPNDKRLNVSIAVAVGKVDPVKNNMEIDAVQKVTDTKIEGKDHVYFVNKYNNPHSLLYNTGVNWPLYRYSDVYLSLAECLVEQGRASEAVQYVNKVRTRAGLPDLTSVTEQDVANERRHEFAFENKRWHDLVRTGKAISVMNEYGVRMKIIDPTIESRAYNVTQERLIYAIPYRELRINSKLTQNTGY